MKFFKKLNNNNAGSKLLFLKNNKKDKSKIQVETTAAENSKIVSESWLDLDLSNNLSSSLDLPDFNKQHQSEHSLGDISVPKSAINISNTPKTIESDNSRQCSVSINSTDADNQLFENPVLKNDKLDASFPVSDLKTRRIENRDIEANGNQDEGTTGMQKKLIMDTPSEDNTDKMPSTYDENVAKDAKAGYYDYGEKETNFYDKVTSMDGMETDAASISLQTQESEESNDQKMVQEEITLLPSSASSHVEFVEIVDNQATPQKEQQGISIPPDELLVKEENNIIDSSPMIPSDKVIANNIEGAPIKVNKKKDTDKRKSAQSLIPRKQFSVEEEDKRPEVKEKKRQTNSYHSASSIPILSATNTNKLVITTTVVVDSNEYYYTSVANSSPSSTTSTSTTTTNTSDNSNTKTQKTKVQQYSKIPVASSLTSSLPKACSSQNHHPASRLPKKMNNV